MELFREYPRSERPAELENDGDPNVMDASHHEEDHPRQDEPEHHAAQGDGDEHWDRAHRGHRTGKRRADREAVDQERARIVEEALALEDDEEPLRRSKLPEYGGRCRSVRWSDDRPE